MPAESTLTDYGPIARHFKRAPLGSLCVEDGGVQTGPFGSQLHQQDYVPVGTPIITVEHLGENRITHQDLPRVSDEDRTRLARYSLREGDIVFSRVGSVDRRALVRKEEDGWLFSGRCLRVRANPAVIWPQFLSWFFGSEGFKKYIRQVAVGATMPSINTKILSDLPIYYPCLDEQKAIAAVLGTLDDKIDLNRRMNATLETSTQAIFKLLFPGPSSAAPPKGWRQSTIGEEVRVVGGSTPNTSDRDFWEGGTHHWATPKDLSTLTSPVLLDTERRITDAGLQQIASGLLPPGTILLSSRAPIGYLVISEVPVAVNQGFIAMVCDKTLPNYFVQLWTKNSIEAIKARANGTTFLEISKGNFRPLRVLVPPSALLADFVQQVDPLYKKIVANLRESQNVDCTEGRAAAKTHERRSLSFNIYHLRHNNESRFTSHTEGDH